DGVFRSWDLGSGKEERTWKPFGDEKQPAKGGATKTKSFNQCAFSPDGKFAAVEVGWRSDQKDDLERGNPKGAPIDYEAVGFDLATNKINWRATAKAPQGIKVRFAYSADGKRVAVAIGPNRVELRATGT